MEWSKSCKGVLLESSNVYIGTKPQAQPFTIPHSDFSSQDTLLSPWGHRPALSPFLRVEVRAWIMPSITPSSIIWGGRVHRKKNSEDGNHDPLTPSLVQGKEGMAPPITKTTLFHRIWRELCQEMINQVTKTMVVSGNRDNHPPVRIKDCHQESIYLTHHFSAWLCGDCVHVLEAFTTTIIIINNN